MSELTRILKQPPVVTEEMAPEVIESKPRPPKPVVKVKKARQIVKPSREKKREGLAKLRETIPTLNTKNGAIQFPDTVRNPDMIRECLTNDEQIFFIDRWTAYYEEYGSDLNGANDYDQLVELIMNQIDLYRLQKKKKGKVALVTDPTIANIQNKISARIQAILESLRARRKDRSDITTHKAENVMKLMLERSRSNTVFEQTVSAQTEKEIQEEEEFLRNKRRGVYGNNSTAPEST